MIDAYYVPGKVLKMSTYMISVILTKCYGVRNKVLTFYIIETENLNNLPQVTPNKYVARTEIQESIWNIYICIQESILKIYWYIYFKIRNDEWYCD